MKKKRALQAAMAAKEVLSQTLATAGDATEPAIPTQQDVSEAPSAATVDVPLGKNDGDMPDVTDSSEPRTEHSTTTKIEQPTPSLVLFGS